MKNKELIKLSFYNLKNRPKTTLQILLSVILIFVVIISVASYSISINKQMKDFIDSNRSESYVNINLTGNEREKILELNNIESIKDIIIRIKPSNKANIHTTLDNATLYIDQTFHRGVNNKSFIYPYLYSSSIFRDQNVYFNIEIVDVSQSMISNNEIQEFQHITGKTDPYISGRAIKNNNEIVMSDYILACFGITDYYNLIGKEISLHITTEDGNSVIAENYILCGILDEGLFRVKSRVNRPHIIIGEEANTESLLRVNCYIKNFSDMVDVSNILEQEGFSASYNAIIYSVYSNIQIQQVLVSNIITIIGFVLILALSVKLISTFLFSINQKENYFGMMKALGLENKKILLIFVYEMTIINIIGAVIAAFLSYVLLNLLNSLLSSYLAVSLQIPNSYALICTFALAFGFIITLIMTLLVFVWIKHRNAAQLLQRG